MVTPWFQRDLDQEEIQQDDKLKIHLMQERIVETLSEFFASEAKYKGQVEGCTNLENQQVYEFSGAVRCTRG